MALDVHLGTSGVIDTGGASKRNSLAILNIYFSAKNHSIKNLHFLSETRTSRIGTYNHLEAHNLDNFPDTRSSLLLRVKNVAGDERAWEEFMEL